MGSIELESGLGVVIEIGRLPLQHSVALPALRRLTARRKLSSVNVFMTGGTLLWSGSVDHVLQAGREIVGLVTLLAWHGPVRSFQWKVRGCMIKSR
jgi:hypothetical protein